MDALELLTQRVSVPRPDMTMPSLDILENMFEAALRAPDHAQLRPWRFLLIEGEARNDLGQLFAGAVSQDNQDLPEDERARLMAKASKKPLRAPLVIIVIASIKPHPKVPEVEQLMSAGAATQNMLLAAHAQGAGAMWRTGGMAYHPHVLQGLGLKDSERLIAYLYVGTGLEKHRLPSKVNIAEYFLPWPKTE